MYADTFSECKGGNSLGVADMKEPKRILIVRTDRIGDVILSTPAIKNLREAYPNTYIGFMSRPYTKEILEGNPDLNEVIIYDKYGRHKSIWATVKFSFHLRKKKFDWAVILHPTHRTHIITFLAGIPFRVGWDKKGGWLLTARVSHQKQQGTKHELEYTLDILRRLNIPIVDKSIYFPLKKEAEEKIEQLLGEAKIERGDKFIVIHPSASCPSKRWPQEHFSQLVRLLKEKTGFPVVVVTSGGEEEFGEKIISANDVIDLRGDLSISELGSLLKRAGLFISNDSGPVHIAAALEVPVISIFGRKEAGLSPLRWKPPGRNSFYFHKDVGCTKCLAHNCQKGFLCLKSITPEEVAHKAVAMIK